MIARIVISMVVWGVVLGGAPGIRADSAPYGGRIFDAHLHYSANSWDSFDAEAALGLLDASKVIGALTSSTPDEGTQRLVRQNHPRVRIVPLYRPYEESVDVGAWFKKPDRLAGAEAALDAGHHHGLGELHIHAPVNLQSERLRALVKRVAKLGLFLQPHSDHRVVTELFKIAPDLKIVWAHAGFSDPPAVVGRMMDTHANLWADLSYREFGIISVDGIDPEWKALLVRHADRFMVGSDTWQADRWHGYKGIIDENRMWLGELPPATADKIAHQNAERLFGLR